MAAVLIRADDHHAVSPTPDDRDIKRCDVSYSEHAAVTVEAAGAEAAAPLLLSERTVIQLLYSYDIYNDCSLERWVRRYANPSLSPFTPRPIHISVLTTYVGSS